MPKLALLSPIAIPNSVRTQSSHARRVVVVPSAADSSDSSAAATSGGRRPARSFSEALR